MAAEKDGAYSLLHDDTHLVDIISWLLDETENLQSPLSAAIEALQVLEEIKAFLI